MTFYLQKLISLFAFRFDIQENTCAQNKRKLFETLETLYLACVNEKCTNKDLFYFLKMH